METPILEARSLEKTYDTGAVRVEALRGVDLALERGEMVAIMGPSGCGKTTLLNCLSGLDSIDGGEALIEGTPLSEMSDRERTDYRARRMGGFYLTCALFVLVVLGAVGQIGRAHV